MGGAQGIPRNFGWAVGSKAQGVPRRFEWKLKVTLLRTGNPLNK